MCEHSNLGHLWKELRAKLWNYVLLGKTDLYIFIIRN